MSASQWWLLGLLAYITVGVGLSYCGAFFDRAWLAVCGIGMLVVLVAVCIVVAFVAAGDCSDVLTCGAS